MAQEFGDLSFPGTTMRIPKVADLVAQDLRHRIASGAFSEGDELPTGTTLMQAYGVSRPTLREAFRMLESENLIAVGRGGHDARVRLPSFEVAGRYAGLLMQLRGTTLADVEAARAIVEPPAAAMLAARGGDPEVLEALDVGLRTERDALDDPIAFSRASFAFHDLVVELARNVTLQAVFSLLGAVLQRHSDIRLAEESQLPMGAADRQTLLKAHKVHQKFVEVVRQQDADEASRLWRNHAEAVGHALRSESDPRRVVDLF